MTRLSGPRALIASSALRALALFLLLLSSPADAERIDLYDAKGTRTGYAIIDRENGRVDYYDPQSRRTGWGQVDQTGRAERFDLQGRRQDSTVVVPVVPDRLSLPRR